MILAAFFRALSQAADPAFRRVLWQGLGLTLALLVALWLGALQLLRWVTPDQITLPWWGEVGHLDAIASGAGILLLLVASAFLMVPVASAFTGLFLDRIAQRVEARHYPALPPARPMPLAESLRDALGFFGLVVAVNLLALVVLPFSGPAAPLLFWAMNGFLLGREYFTLVALRHLQAAEAQALYRRHRATIWAAGTLMAAPLSIPLLNLVIPVLGVATFTHLFQALRAKR